MIDAYNVSHADETPLARHLPQLGASGGRARLVAGIERPKAGEGKMKRYLAVAAVCVLSAMIAITCVAIDVAGGRETSPLSPFYGVSLPDGYREWKLIAPALEDEPLNELRAVVGNAVALDAYTKRALPFPDGSVLVKLAWRRAQSAELESATTPERRRPYKS
jgi:hypothetical protein